MPVQRLDEEGGVEAARGVDGDDVEAALALHDREALDEGPRRLLRELDPTLSFSQTDTSDNAMNGSKNEDVSPKNRPNRRFISF